MTEATAAQRRFAEEDDDICAAGLTKDGVTLIHLTEAERAELAAAAAPEVQKTRARFGAELIALFENDLAKVSL